jgi:uncharacterized membrane protein
MEPSAGYQTQPNEPLFGRSRPRLTVPRTPLETWCELAAVFMLLAACVMPASAWASLPPEIPVHFGISGSPDRWGGKEMLLIFVVVPGFLYTLMTILSRFPHTFNYPVPITVANAARQYQLARELLAKLKLAILTMFAYIEWQVIEVGRGTSQGFSPWFLPVFLVLIVGLTFSYFRAARRER